MNSVTIQQASNGFIVHFYEPRDMSQTLSVGPIGEKTIIASTLPEALKIVEDILSRK
jgi:hypothetical protein